MASKYESRRKEVSLIHPIPHLFYFLMLNFEFQVFLGNLPEDFLRISPSTSSLNDDEAAAWALQQQLNPMAAPAAYYTGFAPPNTRGRLGITVASVRCPMGQLLLKPVLMMF